MGDRLQPSDEQEVVECVRESLARQRTLEIAGGGSRRGVGRQDGADALLDLSGISGVVAYDPTELVLTARAGTSLAELDALLMEHRQMLSFEPPSMGALTRCPDPAPTLGGAIAVNAAGPRRIATGAARDHFLGFRAVSGRGQAFKSGGRVVKNVTGFDLSKLLAGSWGTLAVLTEISVRVMPRPRAAATFAIAGLDTEAACKAMARGNTLPLSVSAASFLPEPAAARAPAAARSSLTLFRLEGFPGSIAARARSLGLALEEFGEVVRLPDDVHAHTWTAIGEVAGLLPAEGPVWRLALPAGSEAAATAPLDPEGWFLDWAGGLVWYCGELPPAGGAEAHARQWRGNAVGNGDRQPTALPDARQTLSRALKDSFDPQGILNPGRLH